MIMTRVVGASATVKLFVFLILMGRCLLVIGSFDPV